MPKLFNNRPWITASFVFGLLSLIPYVGLLFLIPTIILTIIAIKKEGKKLPAYFGVGLAIIGTIITFSIAPSSPTAQTSNTVQQNNTSSIQIQSTNATTETSTTETPSPVIETKTVVENLDVPFEKTTVEDPDLAKGKTEVRTQGINGKEAITYEVTTTDGKETEKKQVKEDMVTSPITEVTAIGTKVEAPAPAPVDPYADATAQCKDGTYSYSAHASGTCSHHGGVARWINHP